MPRRSPTTRVLLALLAGLAIGIAIAQAREPTLLRAAAALEPLGTLWVNAIRMTVVPLVVSLLITRIAATPSGAVGRTSGRALGMFALFSVAAGLFALLAAPPLLAGVRLDADALAAIRDRAAATPAALPPFRDWLTGLAPPNPIKAAADGALLPLLVFTALFALALSRLPDATREGATRLFEAVGEAMFVLVGWVIAAAPIGVFALALGLAARGGVGLASALGHFVVVVCALLVASIVALYPVVALGGTSIARFARVCAASQAVGFSTRSSFAALPVMIDTAQRGLGVPSHVAGLVLPVAASMFKYGTPTARITGTFFVARLYGVELGATEMALVAAAITALSLYTPGIPSASLFTLAPVYSAFGLPVEGVGLLLAVDLVPDMFLTTANVTADMAIATLMARGASEAARATESSTPLLRPVAEGDA
ncbi:sodium:dicarboxylate symporter [Gemmatirosa kalamazoonensis]|uniref:Sodium:dicarboxylate symporter n=1 Tax=Gemmatirosa kalamazoonensis TaxID=861299 RepID=W0RBR7_9BACT|nr:dicarboxylate/amino acid:cation symporter [Gemmatirosa kalamazoonensis]AHG88221.1 sodium:dicarboxylate symporter [Gemmatirosa kalamazoonensis]